MTHGPVSLRSIAALLVVAVASTLAPAARAQSLVLESTITLGEVRGRIDHMAIDAGRRRLYVAELGNNSLGVIDLENRILSRTIAGFSEPQGVAYVPTTDMVYVANAADGSVRVLRGAELTAIDRIDLGDDADNIRYDAVSNRVYVGYGSGALAVIDATARRKIADISLKAHPEGFQIDALSQRIFINVPAAGEIAVVAADQKRQVASWQSRDPAANYPMALDASAQQLLVVYRHPAKFAAMDLKDGRVRSIMDSCSDADDVVVDDRRQRVYVSCGAGFIDSFVRRNGVFELAGRVATVPGARTALFDPVADRLYVAAPATSAAPAAILVLRPAASY